MTKASIIIPAYNCEKFIGATIASIISQTCQDFEILIVDDGSTDTTRSVVESFDDGRIRYFYQENHGGPSKARNVGLENAKGDYIFIFDSDDLMRKEKIELSIKVLEENKDVDILFTRFSLIDENGGVVREDYLHEYTTLSNLIKTQYPDDKAYFFKIDELLIAVVKTNFIGTSSVVLRRAALKNTDRFDEGLKNADDRLFWIQFISAHKGVLLNKVLHDYRVVKSGITSQGMLKKGPNKILALEKAKNYCADKYLIRQLDSEISNNYLAMSRESKNIRNFKMQYIYAKKSIRHKINYKAIKLLISSVIRVR